MNLRQKALETLEGTEKGFKKMFEALEENISNAKIKLKLAKEEELPSLILDIKEFVISNLTMLNNEETDLGKEDTVIVLKTSKYSIKDMYILAHEFPTPADGYFSLGEFLIERFPEEECSKLYKDHWNNKNTEVTNKEAYEALALLIKEKTGVTYDVLEKLAKKRM